jgi:hypothetical protein
MGLEVEASRLFWQRALPEEPATERRRRAREEGWYPRLSEARLRYLMGELEKRFPSALLEPLRSWGPEPERQAPLVCHWHLQWSDPLYLDFTSGYLVESWARSDRSVSVNDVDGWLQRRGSHSSWSESTRRRLASGLLAAARDAGFLRGQGRQKELRTVMVDEASLLYLSRLRELAQAEGVGAAEELFLSGTVREG